MPQLYEQQMEKAISVKGIGKKTAAHLLFFTTDLQDFPTAKALAKFIGIAPNMYQSGNYKIKASIYIGEKQNLTHRIPQHFIIEIESVSNNLYVRKL